MAKALVIGAGPAGCASTHFLTNLGHDVTLIERAPVLGGSCRTFYWGGHPYTLGLLASVPRLGATIGQTDVPRLAEIPGVVPSLREEIRGCAFAPRCAFAVERCRRAAPPLEEKAPGHHAACFESARLAA